MTPSPDLPSYDRPPVIEVVCGMQFEPLDILVTHLGLLWQHYQPEYPTVSEVAPLIPVIEAFGEVQQSLLGLTAVPPMGRTWFVHRDETGIVQVQKDRFLHNWKKVREADDYPRYAKVIGLFRDRLATFQNFLLDVELGGLRSTQYEMTYVNHIVQGEGWNSSADIGSLFPDFAPGKTAARFLPPSESCTWRTAYPLPEKRGRLHVTIRTAIRSADRVPVIVFELTARGFPTDPSPESMWDWFDLAHEWIVRGFTDLTGEQVQNEQWKRTR